MSHGLRALVAEFIDDPDMSNGKVIRRYGRAFLRRFTADCLPCRSEDLARARVRRMHAAYRRRAR